MGPGIGLVAASVIAASVIALSGCSFLQPTPTVTAVTSSSPSPSVIDTTKYIGGQIVPAGTTWTGKDSGGDVTTVTLHADGTVAISYGESSYDNPHDTWRVADGVLHIEVYLDETNGNAEYVGTWNQKTSAIDAVMRTTRTARELTVTLTQK